MTIEEVRRELLSLAAQTDDPYLTDELRELEHRIAIDAFCDEVTAA